MHHLLTKFEDDQDTMIMHLKQKFEDQIEQNSNQADSQYQHLQDLDE